MPCLNRNFKSHYKFYNLYNDQSGTGSLGSFLFFLVMLLLCKTFLKLLFLELPPESPLKIFKRVRASFFDGTFSENNLESVTTKDTVMGKSMSLD